MMDLIKKAKWDFCRSGIFIHIRTDEAARLLDQITKIMPRGVKAERIPATNYINPEEGEGVDITANYKTKAGKWIESFAEQIKANKIPYED